MSGTRKFTPKSNFPLFNEFIAEAEDFSRSEQRTFEEKYKKYINGLSIRELQQEGTFLQIDVEGLRKKVLEEYPSEKFEEEFRVDLLDEVAKRRFSPENTKETNS
jgi:hypothetical protein